MLSELATASRVLDRELSDSLARLASVLQGFFAPHVNAFQVYIMYTYVYIYICLDVVSVSFSELPGCKKLKGSLWL